MADKTRLWIYWNCWTRVTLKKGQTIHIEKGEPTDEGYSHKTSALEFDGEFIWWWDDNYSRDCDGPHEYHSERVAHHMNKKPARENGIAPPNWKTVRQRQRDYYAEAMGY